MTLNPLSTFPVLVQRYDKKKGRLSALGEKHGHHYGHYELDADNRLKFTFGFNVFDQFYKVTVAKHYLYQSLMHGLQFRPVRPPKEDHLWLNPFIFKDMKPPESLDINVLKDYYEEARNRLKNWRRLDLSPRDRRVADEQYQKLLIRQQAIDLIDTPTTVLAMLSLDNHFRK